MSEARPAAAVPPVPDPDAGVELRARRSLRRSVARRAATLRLATRRRRVRHGAVVVLGAMTLVAGGAAAQSGGASSTAKPAATAGGTVSAVQAKLGVAVDGVFGSQSRRALKRWQRAHGLAADGVAGPATLAAMGIAFRTPRATRAMPTSSSPSSALARIARCESGGNPAAVSSSGQYRGKYQFSRATWRRLGGTGDPAAAPEAVQDRIAAKLYAAQGAAPWPSCG